MTKNPSEPLRGDALWKARRAEISKSNDAAQKKGRAERETRDQAQAQRRREAERREFADLPVQPEP
jgi:hypothetical protein